MTHTLGSNSPQPAREVRPGDVYLIQDHGVRRRVRVIARSQETPGYWVCEDLERRESLRLSAAALKAAVTETDPPASSPDQAPTE
jgi:hypothetical protein